MEGDLYQILDLPTNTSTERLGARYEAAVAASTRSEDWRRIAELSRAFDRLPQSVRLAVYPGRERDASRLDGAPGNQVGWRVPVQSPTSSRAARRAERKERARAAYHHTGMRKPFRVGFYVIGAVMIFTVVGAVLREFGVVRRPDVAPAPAEQQYMPGPQQSVVVPVPVAGRVAPPLPVGADGRVVAICQAAASGSGSMLRVLPGTYVTCASGAVPQFSPGT